MEKSISDKLKSKLPDIQENILLKYCTTYKIGGPAKYFFIAKTKDDLMTALKTAKSLRLPVLILGGGSNLLVSEKGFKGLVVKINILDVKFENNKIFVGAGASLTKLAYLSADNGLSGLEWSAGVPGTIGGAIYGNAQAFGEKISDLVESVELINLKTLKSSSFTKKQCKFSLKNSVFKNPPVGGKNLIIVSAVLEFRNDEVEKIKSQIKKNLDYRRSNHPMDFPSAGSVFINPELKIKNKELLEKFPELNEYNKKGVIPAGYLIAKCGLVGKKIGNAQISEKHANFIINLGEAKSKDVLTLISLAQKKVKKNFRINLETEVQLVGF